MEVDLRRWLPVLVVVIALVIPGALALNQDDPDYRTYVPVGALQMYAGDPLDAPTGWLIADGSCVSTVTYANLYAVVGDVFDGCVTPPEEDPAFALPDLRGRVPVGTGEGLGLTGRTLGDLWGAESHTLTINELPAHSHGVTDPGHSHTMARAGGVGGAHPQSVAGTVPNAFNTSTNTTGITIQSAGDGLPHNIMQPSIALNYLIWSGVEALEAPASDIVLTVVVVFPSHTPTPSLTPSLTPTEGPSPTPTPTATPTGLASYEEVVTIGDQDVLVRNEVTTGDAATVGLQAAIVGLLLVGFILFWLRRRS